MTTHMKNTLAAVVILMAGLPVTWAGEPNDSIVPLKFEIRSTALGPFDASPVHRSGSPASKVFATRKPAFAAGIPFEGPTRYLPRPGSGVMNDFLHFVLGEALGMVGTDTHDGLSTAQKGFLRATQGLLDAGRDGGPIPQWRRSPDEPNSPQRLLLYAVTLEDAKAMAQAYAEFVMERWRSDVDEHKAVLEENDQWVAASEARIGELAKLVESSEQALNALKPKIPYRTEKEATEAIAELDRMANAALVDIAGIQSKIRAIQDHLGSRKSPYDDAIKAKLQGMFVEESVALAGAEARKAMATQLRADASRLLDLQEAIANANKERATLRARIIKLMPEMQRERARSESLMTDKPRIADHVIAVYPVEWTAGSEDDSTHLRRP